MLEQIAEKSFDIQTIDVSFIPLEIKSQVLSFRGDREGANSRELVPLIRVIM